ENGYEVYGVVRRSPTTEYENLTAIRDRVELLQADLLDQLSLVKALRSCRPQEVYNLASVSFVPASWEQPILTAEFAAVGVTTLLESIREVDPAIRFYQASSSEIFGEPVETPQTERTPPTPLGLRRRLRAGDVAHAATGGSGRLRDRERRVARGRGARRLRVRPRRPRLAHVRADRPVAAARQGGAARPRGRSDEGA